jgi:hypothetical protein
MGGERRRAKRHRVEHLAIMLAGKGMPSRCCVVTELSDGGIRLISATGFTVPDEFDLRLTASAIPRRYRVIWRFGKDVVGAKLIDPTPSAKTDRAEICAT